MIRRTATWTESGAWWEVGVADHRQEKARQIRYLGG